MITSSLMLCADRVIRDAETNNISAIGILEEITPEGLPLFIPRVMIFALLHRDKEEDPSQIECTLRIIIGDNKLLERKLVVDFKDTGRNRTIINVGGLVISTNGMLEVSLFLEERLLNQFKFIVNPPRRIDVAKQEA
jgi:hypothetical protein